jgi:transposase
MTQLHAPIEAVLGLDVAHKTVTLHDLVTGKTWTVANSRQALTSTLQPFQGSRQLAVCEATGGYEAVLLDVLLQLAIPVHRCHGGRFNAFARSHKSAKTDRLDARILALYGQERGTTLTRWSPPPQYQQELTALVRRRADLVAARKARPP